MAMPGPDGPHQVVIESAIQFVRLPGDVFMSVRGMDDAVPRVLLAVSIGDQPGGEHWLSLGDTVTVGNDTWRFEDLEFGRASNDWQVTIRQVLPDTPQYVAPPLTNYHRIWIPAALQPFGGLDEAGVVALEERIGSQLPRHYRKWLAENNGAAPAEDVWIRNWNFCLNDVHPLLGVRPDFPHQDLGFGERLRRPWLTDDYLVIAVPLGGLLAVKVRGSGKDQIIFLTDQAKQQAAAGYAQGGYASPADWLVANRALVVVTPSINAFCYRLQPMPPVEPAELAVPGQPGPA